MCKKARGERAVVFVREKVDDERDRIVAKCLRNGFAHIQNKRTTESKMGEENFSSPFSQCCATLHDRNFCVFEGEPAHVVRVCLARLYGYKGDVRLHDSVPQLSEPGERITF